METIAVVLEQPGQLTLKPLAVQAPGADDIVVDALWSGISSGTERLLWSGRMPAFPGMGYPLVPGYETVGIVSRGGHGLAEGDRVFVPGANCYGPVRGLFGAAASRIVLPAKRAIPVRNIEAESGILLALAATAHHALVDDGKPLPGLIIGHGTLGRLMARIVLALGGDAPTVWEKNEARRTGAAGYAVIDPATDERRDYEAICEASGDETLLDSLIPRLAKRGEIILAGFYHAPLSFTFPPAFMREARFRIAAEFKPHDIEAVTDLVASGRLSLEGLVSHTAPALAAGDAYQTAFTDPSCLKMALNWSTLS